MIPRGGLVLHSPRVKSWISTGFPFPATLFTLAPTTALHAAAKRNGSWDLLNDVERVGRGAEPPPDLLRALDGTPGARAKFDARPPSEKKQWAFWVLSAKKPETRARRIAETVQRVLAGRRPGM